MDVIALIGRILFSALFIGSGIAHLTLSDGMAEMAKAKKVPAAKLGVIASGVLILLGGLMVLLGVWADLGALFVVAFLLPTSLLMHNFWAETDADTKQLQMIQFQKNMGLTGGALLIFVLYAQFGEQLGLNITDPLF